MQTRKNNAVCGSQGRDRDTVTSEVACLRCGHVVYRIPESGYLPPAWQAGHVCPVDKNGVVIIDSTTDTSHPVTETEA